MPKKRITIALAGNPNSGKTTIFNNLTGARQHVGNYPGVTVEKKEGTCRHEGATIHAVDLPGTYSLTAYSVEEVVARQFIVDEKPDVLVDIIDASNLERNLYLAVQFMELGVPLVLAFNMWDVAKAQGIDFDLEQLSRLLGAPIVPTVGNKGRGTKELLDAVLRVAEGTNASTPPRIHYGNEIEREIERIQGLLDAEGADDARYSTRWLAIKLLENDREVRRVVKSEAALRTARQGVERLRAIFGDPPETLIPDRRYGFISGACQEAVRSTVETRHTVSDKIDTVLTHQGVGLLIFLAMMYLVFHLTFTLGEYPMGWIESLFAWLGRTIAGFWPRGSDSFVKSLLVDGIIAGVGGVVVFLPNILLLFLAIAFLEDSGYMARAAFLMDRLMHKIGLHGKSFIPMLIGFGCSVPAILATRTLDSRRDRLVTMLIVPLMSCGARLPIYALIIPAFFPRAWQAPMLWGVYLIGIILAILCARLLRATLFKGQTRPFVMELPPYRLPTVKGLLIHTWSRGWMYLKKAGTVILAISIVLWFMTTFPKKRQFDRDYDAEASRARAALLAATADLNVPLRLPEDSDVLVAAVRAELEAAERRRQHWPHEQAYAEVEKARDAALAKLKRGEHGRTLASFLEARRQILQAREDFARAVKEDDATEGTARHAELVRLREAALSDVKKKDPQTFDAVAAYLDTARAPFDQRSRDIENGRRAEQLAYSVAGRIGHGMEPAIKPLGFDWRIGTALIGALAAKEVFVAQLGIVYAVGEADEQSEALRARLRARYTPLQGFCIVLFCLISTPCVATVACTWKESGSWRWAALQLLGLTVLAYVLTAAVYQVGRLIS